MVLEKLSDSLKNTLQKVTKSLFVDEKLINELVKDIQRALLQSDVNVQMVFDVTKKIKERALKETGPSAISKKENLVRIVYDELVDFLGGPGSKIDVTKKKPYKIMLVGLFGSGKTTLAGKLGRYYKSRGVKVGVIQTDTWRPAAYDQLKQLAEKAKVNFYGEKDEKDPVKIYKKHKKDIEKNDLVIIDSAGRDALSDDLIEELNQLSKEVGADEKLLVLSADIGQAAEKQAKAFHESAGITGVVITKLDGTAKGGGALIACSVTGSPVKFIGVGEGIADLEEFKPEGFVGRLLGMGDLEALLDKAKEAMTAEEAEDLGKKFLKGDYSLIDLYEQMKAMKKMGSLSKLMEMIPGMGQLKIPKEALEVQEGNLEKWKHAMDSMTKEELEDAEILDGSRVQRVAQGSGLNVSDVRSLVKQYRQSKKLVKMMKGNDKNMDKLMKRMGGGMNGMKF